MASGLKRGDIRPCAVCGKGLAKGGPLVYRVTVDRLVLDPRAIQRHAGLEMQIGAALASVMGTNEDLAVPLDTSQVVICGDCLLRPLAAILEDRDQPVESDRAFRGDNHG